MQRLFHLNCRRLLFNFQRAQNHDFSQTNRSVRMGLPFSIDEKQAIDAFDRWRKSFWLAPRDWQKLSVTIHRRFVPFWAFRFKGSVSAEAYVNRGAWIWGGDDWQRLADRVTLKDLDLNDIYVYAAHIYDRQHMIEIDLKKNESLQPLDRFSMFNDDLVDEWTVDRDTAFEIGWDMTVVNKLQDLCLEKLNRQKKGNYRITSVRFPIKEETQELIYLPVYVVDYQYLDRQLQCLINGRTGQVAGLRQFSQTKISSFLLAFAYPICATSLISILSLAFYSFSGRIAIIPIALLVTGVTLPPTIFGTLQIGRYVRDFSHFYRGKHDIREWLEFKKKNSYRFTERDYGDQDRSGAFQYEQTRETRKSTPSLNIGPDLYGILGVSRVASNSAIKQAYLIKAKEFHPDRNVGSKEIEEKFKLINHAYAILSDSEQRQLFDEYGYDHVKYK